MAVEEVKLSCCERDLVPRIAYEESLHICGHAKASSRDFLNKESTNTYSIKIYEVYVDRESEIL